MFIKFMHRELEQHGRSQDIGFLSSQYISQPPLSDRQLYITQRLCNNMKKLYLTPYYNSHHWQLVLICTDHKVVFLCSTHNDPPATLKQIVNKPLKNFQMKVLKINAFHVDIAKALDDNKR
ncbi:hypothetical protein K1719_012186 [Acacia pycnantha]|nr:hypothetical protein K1719_012186 [Acacia pycnantha]